MYRRTLKERVYADAVREQARFLYEQRSDDPVVFVVFATDPGRDNINGQEFLLEQISARKYGDPPDVGDQQHEESFGGKASRGRGKSQGLPKVGHKAPATGTEWGCTEVITK